MSLLRRPLSITVLAIVAAGWCAAGLADPLQGPDRGARSDQRGQRPRNDDALSDSVRRIERTTRGQVLSAERMQSDGRDVNRIKVVDDRGRVRVYMDDPQRGDRQPPRPQPPTRDDDD